MKKLLPILKTKLFLLSFVSGCTVILATTVPQVRNLISSEKTIKEKVTSQQKKISPNVKKQNRTASSLRVTSSVSLEMNNSFEATVTTDKLDYSPGEHVVIDGSGWLAAQDDQPGETVSLSIVSDCGCTHVNLSAVADVNGNIHNEEFLITEAHIGASFVLTATGLTSGLIAQTNFTDGNMRGRTVSPTNTGVTLSTTFYDASANCSGSGTTNTFDAAANFGIITAADDDESLTLTAPATNSAGEAFRFWRVSGRNSGLKGSRNLTICVPGRSSGNLNITAYYGDCPLNGGIPPEPTGVMATPSAICSGGTSSLNANTGNGNLVFWYTQETGGTEIGIQDSEEDFEVTATETTTYWAESVSDGGCVNPTRVSVTVSVSPVAAITSVTGGTSPLCIGQTTDVTANGVELGGGTGAWSSSDAAVATVNASGHVTAVGAGSTNIIYTITDGCSGTKSAYQAIEVRPNAAVTSVTGGTSPLCIGQTTDVIANGVVLGGGTGAWSSSDAAVATVNASGHVTAVGAGSTNIIYTITDGCSGTKSAYQAIEVGPNAAVTSVTGGTSPLCIGATTDVIANGVVLGGGTGAWSSSDAAIATVNASGHVTAVGAGTTNITYTITGGCSGTKSAYQAIEVRPNAAVTSVTGGTSPLCIGQTTNVTANGIVLGGGTGGWSSTDAAVATVNASGQVTAVGAGSTNITYTITGGCGGPQSAYQTIQVLANAAITSVTGGTSPLCINETTDVIANGVVLGGGTGAWSSSDAAVATVNASGHVTAVGAGTTNITYTITGGCSGTKSAYQAIEVRPNAAVTSVTGGTSPLCIGATTDVTANGVVLGGGTGAWSSSDAAVATVNASGHVTAVGAGTTNITYTITGGCNGTKSAYQAIEVRPDAAVTSVTGGTSPLCIGATTNVTANGVVLGGGSGGWSSSNPAAATVNSSGLVTAVGAGTTNVVYTITDGCSGTKTAYQAITVLPNAAITSVTGTPSSICPGATTTYVANGVVLGGGTGVWSSSDATVATVSSSGVVTGIAPGTANITFAITGGCNTTPSAQKSVTVKAPTVITGEFINSDPVTNITIVYGCTTPVLNVTATGEGTVRYKWFKNTTNSNSGGTAVTLLTTTSSYTVPPASPVGTHYYYAEVTAGCGTVKSNVFKVVIAPQPADAENDGKLYYTGTCMAWTPTATSNSATVTLAAFVKNKAGEQYTCGDIATARITFQVRNSSGVWTDIPSAQNLPVYYVDPNDPSKGGTANAIVQLSISNNTATQIFDLRVVVSGNYQARPDCGTAQITVSKLVPGGSISGGVLLCGPSSSGLLKPATSILTPSWLGFGVEYTVKGKQVQSPKGKVNLLVPSFFTYEGVNTFPQLNWYKISSNAIASLAITTPKATFTAKANVAKYNPNTGETIPIEGNCTMVLDLEDLNTNGVFNFQDKVGITIYRNNGGNWYSNNWVTSKTVPTTICGGDLTVSGITNSAPCISCPTTRTNTSIEAEVQVAQFNVRAFPNPSQHVFSLVLENATNEKVQIVVYDALGRQVKMFEKQSGNIPIHFGMDLKVGVYVVEVRQGDNQKTLKLVKQ